MSAIVGPAITLAESICNIIATDQAMANLNALKSAQLSLNAEVAKGDAADDGLIESLHSQITVLLQAVNSQYALHIAAPTPTAA